jgi:hypothetical protein
MEQDAQRPIAWVESPLQLVAAAEWASKRDDRIIVALRVVEPQMARTARELLDRGARFAECIPFFGIPWQLLNRHRDWAIGDGFSGQFRMAGTVLRPRSVSFLDDGALTLSLADALLDRSPYARPGNHESAVAGLLGNLARDRMLSVAARERLEIATAFDLGAERTEALAQRGIHVTQHQLDWVRETARPIRLPGNRVLLGSALPTDGRMPVADYLRWVETEARRYALVYLPHRRERREVVDAAAALPGVTVKQTGLPIELVLAGTTEPLEILTLPSSVKTTLGHLLEGTGSVINERQPVREIIH